MNPVNIAGPRLHLRELHHDDVDALHTVQGNAEVTRHMTMPTRTREQVADVVSRAIATASADPRDFYLLAVVRAEDRRLVGYANLNLDLDPLTRRAAATIGFMLHPDVWGGGFGTETVHLLLTLGFRHLGLHRVGAARAPLNEGSEKTLLRAGFTEEGRIRHHVRIDGVWRDSLTYSILEDEWRAASEQQTP